MTAAGRRWLRAHAADPFVQRARRENYRSRAVFRLAEIDRREKLCRRGMTVLELGAAPGGWTCGWLHGREHRHRHLQHRHRHSRLRGRRL